MIAALGAAVDGPARPERLDRRFPQPLDMVVIARRNGRPRASPRRRSRRTAPATTSPSACPAPARRRGSAVPAPRPCASTGRRFPSARGSCARRSRPGPARREMRQPAERLDRIAQHQRAARMRHARDLGDRLDHADLVVDHHHRDQQHAFVELAPRDGRGRAARPARPEAPSRSMPCPASHSQRVEHGGMLGGDVMIRLRCLARAFSTVPLSAQLSASVALPVKATLPPFEPDRVRSTCLRATSIAASASWPQREGECGLANFSSIHGLHRLGDFGRDRRRRLIIEVDHAARAAARRRSAATRRESGRRRLRSSTGRS